MCLVQRALKVIKRGRCTVTTNSVVEKCFYVLVKRGDGGGTAGDQERNGNKKREMNSGTPWKDVGHAVMLLVRAPCSCSLFVHPSKDASIRLMGLTSNRKAAWCPMFSCEIV